MKCLGCSVRLLVVFKDELCSDCRTDRRREKRFIGSNGPIKMTCDECPTYLGPHCNGCETLKGEWDDLSDAIQERLTKEEDAWKRKKP